MSATPRAVLFDADGVLQSMGPVAEHLRGRFGWSDYKATAFLHDYWARESECGCLEGRSEFAGVLEELLIDWEIADDPAVFYQDFLTAATLPHKENLALAAEVRAAGILCALATNQESGRARFMTDNLGYARVFDHLFFACELRCAKPSPAYFEAILAALDMPAEGVLFLDDRAANVETATTVGLRAELVAEPREVRRILTSYALVG